jgi:hypothetical protein
MITVIATIVSGVIGTGTILLGARFLLAPQAASEDSSVATGVESSQTADRRKSDRNCELNDRTSLFRRPS